MRQWNGPIVADWILFDDASDPPERIVKIVGAGYFAHKVGDILEDVGSCRRWIVTKIGDMLVEDWHKMPPSLCFIIYGHCIDRAVI